MQLALITSVYSGVCLHSVYTVDWASLGAGHLPEIYSKPFNRQLANAGKTESGAKHVLVLLH